jgi:hypothetical protein
MGLGSEIRKKPIPDPGSRGQKGAGSRIPDTEITQPGSSTSLPIEAVIGKSLVSFELPYADRWLLCTYLDTWSSRVS